MFKVQLAAIRL